jgi:uncharacterized protein YceH (UPF0502 family)
MGQNASMLDSIETRILGVLIEKQHTTPANYPLSLHAVVAGCNQTTNRHPIMMLDEPAVERALVDLHNQRLATPVRKVGDRVTKYRHKLDETLEVDARELALLSVLALRGPQTPGELRSRTDRYTTFDDLRTIDETLVGLASRGFVRRLDREPGQKESRFQQLVGEEGAVAESSGPTPGSDITQLRSELDALAGRFEELLERLGVTDL